MLRYLWKKWKNHKASNEEYIDQIRELGVEIGEGCEIYKNSVLWGSEPYLIKIGNHVRITAGVQFITHDGGVWTLRGMGYSKEIDLFGKIVIEDNVHVGMNTTIMPGVTIGKNSIIGCGAIVTRDIPEESIAVGVPARVISTVEQYYEKHKDEFDFTKSMSSEQKRAYLLKKYGME